MNTQTFIYVMALSVAALLLSSINVQAQDACPCKVKSDDDFIRVHATKTSPDEGIASDWAMLRAQRKMASTVQTKVKSAVSQYIKSVSETNSKVDTKINKESDRIETEEEEGEASKAKEEKDIDKSKTTKLIEKYEDRVETAVEQTLEGYDIVCDDVVETDEAEYKGCIALEMPRKKVLDDIFDDLEEDLKDDDDIKDKYDSDTFRKIFDKEMDRIK